MFDTGNKSLFSASDVIQHVLLRLKRPEKFFQTLVNHLVKRKKAGLVFLHICKQQRLLLVTVLHQLIFGD